MAYLTSFLRKAFRKSVTLLRRLRDKYVQSYERTFLDVAVGSLEGRFARTERLDPPISITGSVPSISFLVGTGSYGVVRFDSETASVIVPGSCYGITRAHDGKWLTSDRRSLHSRILRFDVEGRTKPELVISGLSRGVHQIDRVGADLFVADTYNNRLLTYDLQRPGARSWRRKKSSAFPAGRLSDGRSSTNYRHFNSVFHFEGRNYVVAHNETQKTGRQSELYVLDRALDLVERRSLNASNAHNFFCDGKTELYCASLEGTLRERQRDVVTVGSFTRGLAVSDDYILLGGTDFKAERADRAYVDGYVYVLNQGFEIVATIVLHRTEVFEIRRLDVPDRAMSANTEGGSTGC